MLESFHRHQAPVVTASPEAIAALQHAMSTSPTLKEVIENRLGKDAVESRNFGQAAIFYQELQNRGSSPVAQVVLPTHKH